MLDTLHGRRALVFDSLLFVDDVKTPLSMTMKPARIVCNYGYRQTTFAGEPVDWKYPDCVDVVFDHRPGLSRGHFTKGIKLLD